MIALALRTWVHFLVPLTVLAIIACAPLLCIAWTAPAAADAPRARIQLRLTSGASRALVFAVVERWERT